MKAQIRDLGRIAYDPCTELQRELLEQVSKGNEPDTLLLVEHDPVVTLGAGYHEANLLLSPEQFAERGVQIAHTGRGGDVTYHGPGQLVLYPIFDLTRHGKDLHLWLRSLEQAMIDLLAKLQIQARRFPPHTGVWIGNGKVAAIGIQVRKWISMHGIALNCDNDLAPFGWIVPCGIQGHGVTSISRELSQDFTVEQAKPLAVETFQNVFGLEFEIPAPARK